MSLLCLRVKCAAQRAVCYRIFYILYKTHIDFSLIKVAALKSTCKITIIPVVFTFYRPTESLHGILGVMPRPAKEEAR